MNIGQFVPEDIFAGPIYCVRQPRKIMAITLALVPLQVLGRVTKSAAVAAAYAGNTGNGTLTVDATTPILGAKAGVYKVILTGATAFKVLDPDGVEVDAAAALGTFANQIKFAIAAGGVAFVAGDYFTVTVSGSGDYGPYDSRATDGRERPAGILLEDVAISVSEQVATVAMTGMFPKSSLVFANPSDTFALIEEDLHKLGIFGGLAVER